MIDHLALKLWPYLTKWVFCKMTILQQAIDQYKPSSVFALFSGGMDSLAMVHYTAKHCPKHLPFKVAHINTGIGIEQTREFVRQTCHEQGWQLLEYKTPIAYKDLVCERGFPGPTTQMHQIMYTRLKDRGIDQLIRENKRQVGSRHKRFDRIILASGIRKQESKRRMGYASPINRRHSQVWTNTILNWSKVDVRNYIEDNGLRTNPVSDILGYSGECLCGCFADSTERALIDTFFPDEAKMIADLEADVRRSGFNWKWHEGPPRKTKAEKQIEQGQTHFMPLCVGCQAKSG